MQRDSRAFLLDLIEAADAISHAVADIGLDAYETNRLVRSAVEREFIAIGDELNNLARGAPELFSRINQARRIISFRNKITHD